VALIHLAVAVLVTFLKPSLAVAALEGSVNNQVHLADKILK
jgi:hypothetical protein